MNDRLVPVGDMTPEQRRIHRVEHILRRDGGSPGSALEGLAAILEEETWRKVPAGPDVVEPFASFTAFVEAPAPFGLGYSIRQLRALLKLEHPDEKKSAVVRERMDAMRVEVERLLGEEIPEARDWQRPTLADSNKDDATNYMAESNSAEYVVSRLKRDDPELAGRVINGEVTANAAARVKGWRKPRIVVSSPERTAVSLRKHMPPEQLVELARLLHPQHHADDKEPGDGRP